MIHLLPAIQEGAAMVSSTVLVELQHIMVVAVVAEPAHKFMAVQVTVD
jgi:hypothetical protein